METPKPTPDELALAMVQHLGRLNDHLDEMKDTRIDPKVIEGLGGLIDELNDWYAVVDKTMEILNKNNSGKGKLSLADFAQAWEMAAEEIFEGEGEEEEDDGDILASSRG